jgi:hypothetical protein
MKNNDKDKKDEESRLIGLLSRVDSLALDGVELNSYLLLTVDENGCALLSYDIDDKDKMIRCIDSVFKELDDSFDLPKLIPDTQTLDHDDRKIVDEELAKLYRYNKGLGEDDSANGL